MRSLVVDDNRAGRLVLESVLKEFGEVDQVDNGNDAILAFFLAINEKKPYQFISLDIIMEPMSGIDTLREIRRLEDDYNLPAHLRSFIMMITSEGDRMVVHQAVGAGCNAYVIKPVSKEAVRVKVKGHLASREKNKNNDNSNIDKTNKSDDSGNIDKDYKNKE